MIYLTADTSYQLFVNGSFVQRGAARSAAHHQSYDALAVTGFLRPGKNLLAVRVHHTGVAQPYHEATRPGLLVQLDLWRGGAVSTVGTDRQWKIMRDPAWDSGSPFIDRGQHDGSADIVDLRKRPDDWMSPDFNDASWPLAVSNVPRGVMPATNNRQIPGPGSWWPRPRADFVPQAITPPWVALVPRDLPPLLETTVRASRLAFAGNQNDQVAAQARPDPAAYRFTALPLLKLPPLDETKVIEAA